MRRYKEHCDDPDTTGMGFEPDGPWVMYADAKAEIDRAKAGEARAIADLRECKRQLAACRDARKRLREQVEHTADGVNR